MGFLGSIRSFTVMLELLDSDIDNDHIATFQISTYAGISSDKGLTIINITDIGSPTHVSRYSGKPDGVNGFLPAVTAFVSIDGSTYALSEYGVRVAIFKANNLVSFNPIAVIIDGQDSFTELTGPSSIATTTIGSSTYALVASGADNGVQIINITTPGSPIAASAVSDGPKYTELEGPLSITTTTIGSSTYALVASGPDDGVQIIDITNPYAPTNTSSVEDGSNFPELDYPRSIITTTIGSSTYALVASETDRGVQIIDITTPSDPKPVSDFDDGDTGFTTLRGAQYITTTTIGSSTYALVAANRDNGVQIIDITDPYHPDPVSAITDGSKYTELEGAESIAIIPGLPTYALVSSKDDDGIQIIHMAPAPKFSSDNQNPAYAKAGDTLTLEFSVNDTIVSNTTQFTNPDRTPSVAINDGTYIATLTVPSDLISSYADFEITLENNQTVRLSVTEDDFPPNVFIDTIAPTIELEGDADYIVYIGDHDYIIPGAIASDGSPGYSASDYGTTIDGTLDPDIVGSKWSIVSYSHCAAYSLANVTCCIRVCSISIGYSGAYNVRIKGTIYSRTVIRGRIPWTTIRCNGTRNDIIVVAYIYNIICIPFKLYCRCYCVYKHVWWEIIFCNGQSYGLVVFKCYFKVSIR